MIIHGKEYTKVHKDVYLDNSYFEYKAEVVWYKTIIFCVHAPNKNKLCFSFQSTLAVFTMNDIKNIASLSCYLVQTYSFPFSHICFSGCLNSFLLYTLWLNISPGLRTATIPPVFEKYKSVSIKIKQAGEIIYFPETKKSRNEKADD